MTIYEWIASLIGILQCALIAYGLRTMRAAGEHRNREGERRHAEAMTALDDGSKGAHLAHGAGAGESGGGLTRAKYKPNTSQIQGRNGTGRQPRGCSPFALVRDSLPKFLIPAREK